MRAINTGIWSDQATTFRGCKDRLTVWGDTLYLDNRFYVPEVLRVKTLEIAHLGHASATSMKRQLRELAWWPNMTVDADSFHAECRSCSLTSDKAIIPPLSPRELPLRPMDELHIDFFEMSPIPKLLVVTDAYSRYIWIIEMNSTTTACTIKALQAIFDGWGKPRLIQSDCGRQFVSKEFVDYWKSEGVGTRTTIPYASHTNGLVERHMKPIAHALRIALIEGKPWRLELSTYIRAYNTRPHSSTKFSPFQLLQGRKYHDYLPVFDSWDGTYELPPSRSTVEANNTKAKLIQKKHYDARHKVTNPMIAEGDWVMLRDNTRINKANPAYLIPKFKVMKVYKAMAIVRSEKGKDYIRWVAHLKKEANQNLTWPNEPIEPDILRQFLEVEEDETQITHPVEEDELSPATAPDSQEVTTPVVSKAFNLRDRKLISIPARYLNCVFTTLD